MRTRRMSLLMAIIIMLTLLPQMAIPAQAAYENTYKNTGDQRADIIGVALTQVGYLEGSGNNNKNKYSEYFGYGARAWCGDFVSWCARQAGIPKSVLKNSGPAKPSTFGITTVHKSDYTPKPGDLFFKPNYGHVGIVYYTSGKYFYTIEGNTWDSSPRRDGVYIRKRLIADFYFGVPNYTSDSGSSGNNSCDHKFTTSHDESHPHKEFKICSKCSYKTYTGDEVTVKNCKSCVQESCSHKYNSWEKTSSTKHKKTCSLCGKSVTESHTWSEAVITTEPTCTKSGIKTKTCKSCKAEKTEKIPATGQHAIDDVQYIDSKYHGQTCMDCGKVIKSKHKITKEWTADGKNHWYYCEDCGERYQLAEHIYDEGCGSGCKICGYISPFNHQPGENYCNDDTDHWKICERCSANVDPQPHNYTSDCDLSCDVCDYQRVPVSQHDMQWLNEEGEHWQKCTVCLYETPRISHTPDPNAKDWEDQQCLDCAYIVRSCQMHVHSLNTIKSDMRTHWGTCACGAQIPIALHSFQGEFGSCSICGASNYTWIVLLIAAVFGAVVFILLVLLFIRRLSRRRI